MSRRRRPGTRFSTGRPRTRCRLSRRRTRTAWSGTGSPAPRRADRAVATGPSDGRTLSWRPRALQRFAHRDRVLLVPRIAIERLGLRVHATREDDHVRRALLLGQAFEVLHEARGHAEAAGIRLDEEFRHLRIRRWIEGRRDSEARESHESTASLRHDNRFEALHLTESPGNRPFHDRLAKVGAVECLEQRDEGRGVFAVHEANSEAGSPRLDGHAFTPPLSRNAGP